MKRLFISLLLVFSISGVYSQQSQIDHAKVREDFNITLQNLAQRYVYLSEKQIDLDCIRQRYSAKIESLESRLDVLLFFEFLLDELYDNHITLTANANESYRLFAPLYVTYRDEIPVITQVWQTQIANLDQDLVGAEILKFNGESFEKVIQQFPTTCSDKSLTEIREWTANKVLSGRYSQPRVLTLKLRTGEEIQFDLDKLRLKEENTLLTVTQSEGIGIIRVNNSLGNDNLVTEFDRALDGLWDTKGLILDLRNTIFGGDSYEARGIMSRFVSEPKAYQKHAFMAKSQNNPDVERSWLELVSPRGKQYTQPVVILVGRWTGSMGEGLAIGFEGIGRGEVVGSEMRRLAGEVRDFGFKHETYGYKLSTARLMHVNGTPREAYVPTNYVQQKTNKRDEVLARGIELIKRQNK